MSEASPSHGVPPPAQEKQTAAPLPAEAVPADGNAADFADPADAERQRQQLQLIQLCFYEHEFGVDTDDDDDGEDAEDAEGLPHNSSRHPASLLDFDPLTFIDGKVGHGVALEDLCKDLAFYAEYIKEKINHHVNNDMHTAFVDVSGRLGGMESELQYLERPLEASIKRVSAACEGLASAAEAVSVKVQHASDAEMERVFDVNYLKGLLLYEKVASTIEEEITPLVDAGTSSSCSVAASPAARKEVVGSGPSSRATSLSPSRPGQAVKEGSAREAQRVAPAPRRSATAVDTHMLEKLQAIALSAKQLRTLAEMLPALPRREEEKRELLSYVRESDAAVHRLLRRVFEHLCGVFFEHPEEAGVTQALRDVTQIYANSHARGPFCVMFKESVLAPFLERVFPWKAATQARQSADETVRLLEHLDRELRSNITPLFPLFRRCFAAEPLNPASSILWPVLCETLVKKLVTLYEVGIPDAFHRKYEAAYKLLALAESCCSTPEELVVLRQSPDVAMWNHKWNTEVYTAMRVSEAAKALEPALSAYRNSKPVSELQTTAEGSLMKLEVFRVLHEQLLRLFSSPVFLWACLHKFLREAVTTCQAVCHAVLTYSTQALQGHQHSNGNAEQTLLPFLSLLMADAGRLEASCSTDGALHRAIQEAVARCGGDGRGSSSDSGGGESAASQAIEGSLKLIQTVVCGRCVGEAQRLMTGSVEEECLAALQNLKSVRSAYSHTNKPFPTMASWYVARVVDPIVRFAKVCQNSNVDAVGAARMLGTITDSVAAQFTALARETLITAKKTEESWEKLRRKKDAVGTGGESGTALDMPPADGRRPTAATATDRDKMTLQLYLDAKTFEDATRPLVFSDAAHARSAAMEALFSLLQRAEWILGADIPEPPELEDS